MTNKEECVPHCSQQLDGTAAGRAGSGTNGRSAAYTVVFVVKGIVVNEY